MFFNSNFAVKGFFAISGFLVTKSFLRCQTTKEYIKKRFRRIYPAYLTSIIFCFIIGFFATTLSPYDFLKSPSTIKYVLSNAAFLNFLQPTLPATFANNPAQALNGSLWTIKVELMLYFCVPFLVFFYQKIGTTLTTAMILLLSIAWVYYFTFYYDGAKGQELARQFPGQLSYFALGGFFAVNDIAAKFLKIITLISLFIIFLIDNNVARIVTDPIAYSSIVIFLSTAAVKSINAGRYGDISYGLYLFHFPIIQFFIFLEFFNFDPWVGVASVLFTTLVMALLSWHFVEKRMLKRSSHYIVASQS